MSIINSNLYKFWLEFFRGAGIISEYDAAYAQAFTENRIKPDMLMELDKDVLLDMGVCAVGDKYAIIRHAKFINEKFKLSEFEIKEDENPHVDISSEDSEEEIDNPVVPSSYYTEATNESESELAIEIDVCDIPLPPDDPPTIEDSKEEKEEVEVPLRLQSTVHLVTKPRSRWSNAADHVKYPYSTGVEDNDLETDSSSPYNNNNNKSHRHETTPRNTSENGRKSYESPSRNTGSKSFNRSPDKRNSNFKDRRRRSRSRSPKPSSSKCDKKTDDEETPDRVKRVFLYDPPKRPVKRFVRIPDEDEPWQFSIPIPNPESSSVDDPIVEDNKGFKMLTKIGWKGGSLGCGDGIKEPLKFEVRKGRTGLGANPYFDDRRAKKYVAFVSSGIIQL